VSRITFCLSYLCRSQHTFWIPEGDRIPPWGPGDSSSTFLSIDGGRSWISSSDTSQGVRHRHFLALMVDALGSPALPPRGSAVDVYYDDVGAPRSWLAPTRGPAVNIFYVDGGCSRISISTRQGGCYLCFLALMVYAPRSTAPASPRGTRHQHFLALMVVASGSLAPASPRGPASMFLSVDGRCSRISSSNTS
jgi:hypothetical protein